MTQEGQEGPKSFIVLPMGELPRGRGKPSEETKEAREPRTKKITEKELEVLRLMAQGKTNRQIAENLGGLSVRTVEAHQNTINRKLGTKGSSLRSVLVALEFDVVNLLDATANSDLQSMGPLKEEKTDINILEQMTKDLGAKSKNDDIAEELKIKSKNVEYRISKMVNRTNAGTRIHLVLMYLAAKKQGIV